MRGAVYRLAVLSVVLALCGMSEVSADDAKTSAKCTLLQVSSQPMRTDPDGRITVPARAGGRAVHMIVDTGGIFSALDSSIVAELRLNREAADGQILAGNVPITKMAEVDRFELGHQHADGFRLMVMPSQALGINDDGLIGANILKFYDVEFDFAHAKFNMFSQDHCKGQVVYWTKQPYAAISMHVDREWHITVPVTLNGKEVTAVIDSGAAHSIMTLETAKDVFGIDVKDLAMKSLGQSSLNGTPDTEVYRYPFSSLNFQGVTVNNPEIELIPQNSYFRRGGPQLLVGIGILRQLRVYVAYGEQVLYVTPAEAQ